MVVDVASMVLVVSGVAATAAVPLILVAVIVVSVILDREQVPIAPKGLPVAKSARIK